MNVDVDVSFVFFNKCHTWAFRVVLSPWKDNVELIWNRSVTNTVFKKKNIGKAIIIIIIIVYFCDELKGYF